MALSARTSRKHVRRTTLVRLFELGIGFHILDQHTHSMTQAEANSTIV